MYEITQRIRVSSCYRHWCIHGVLFWGLKGLFDPSQSSMLFSSASIVELYMVNKYICNTFFQSYTILIDSLRLDSMSSMPPTLPAEL